MAQELRQTRKSEETRKDSAWKKESTLSLRGVKEPDDLQELINDIKETSSESIQNMKVTQRAILSRYPWSTWTIDAWVDCGYITRIAEDSLSWYLDLLQHLLHTADTLTWQEAKREIDFRVKELGLIRTSTNRLLCLCKTYIYLREASETRWTSSKLEKKKVQDLTKEIKSLKGGGGGSVCSKCKTGLHGDAPCPWSKLTAKKAQAQARKFLVNMAKGEVNSTGGGDGSE